MEFKGFLGMVFVGGSGELVLCFYKMINWEGKEVKVSVGKMNYMWFGNEVVKKKWEGKIGEEYRMKKDRGEVYVNMGYGWLELYDC